MGVVCVLKHDRAQINENDNLSNFDKYEPNLKQF